MKKTLLVVATIASILAITTYASAQSEMMVSPAFLKAINSPLPTVSYYEQDSPAEKLGVGILNTFTAWTDIPAGVREVSEEDNVVAGSTLGFAQGLVTGIARSISGVYDMATCGFAPYDKPSMTPAYKVEDPQKEGLKVNLATW